MVGPEARVAPRSPMLVLKKRFRPYSSTTGSGYHTSGGGRRLGIVKLGHSEQLIRRLLKLNHKKRLGCGASGAEAVKNDAFFSANDGVDWSAVYEQQVVPPFVPELSGDADTRYFDLQPYDLFEMDASTDLTGEARQLWSKIPDS